MNLYDSTQMAITALNQSRADNVIGEIKTSSLPSAVKDDLIEGTNASLTATNGLTPEEKLQACCENQFRLQVMIARIMVSLCDKRSAENWKTVIISCRWQICVALAIIGSIIVLRPEVAKLIEIALKNGV